MSGSLSARARSIGMRPLLQDALVRVEHHVDRHVAIRVNPDLPVGAVRFLDALPKTPVGKVLRKDLRALG